MDNKDILDLEESAANKPRNQDFDYLAHVLGVAILVGALIISGVLVYNFKMLFQHMDLGNSGQTQNTQAQAGAAAAPSAPTAPAAALVNVSLKANVPYLGSNTAKVTVIEYADYQCPYCEQFFKTVVPDLQNKYIMAGKIKFIYQDFALLGADSNTAAEASHCAADQNKFWQYHDYLFGNQGQENSGWADALHQKQYAAASELKLNTSQFGQCLDSGKYKQEVLDETAAGQKYAVSGTPSFLILKNGNTEIDTAYIQTQLLQKKTVINLPNGNIFIVGAQPSSAFGQAIDAALSK